jgi:dethiobiotin synthetase
MKENKKYFITAIGTDVGKTIVSAILCESMQANYWKPIQCGNLDFTDSDFIRKNTDQKVFPERYRFELAASPHLSSKEESVVIDLKELVFPETANDLIIEGAGGMMVPLNDKNDLIIDIAKKNSIPLIVVSSFYLGSINHTLLSLEYAKNNDLKVSMLIFTGERNKSSLDAIRNFFPNVKIGFIPFIKEISKKNMKDASDKFSENYLHELV